MLTIYTENITSRIVYTLSIIFDDRQIKWQVTDDFKMFQEAPSPKFAYAKQTKQEICIPPSVVLFETGIKQYAIQKTNWKQEEILSFDAIPDVLASVFYVISLYDDYLQVEKDKHGRNIGEKSILYQFGWLDKLQVERWSEALIDFIEEENKCSLNRKKIPFQCVPTFDIDNTYAYRLKGRFRLILSVFKDVFNGNKRRIKERSEVLNNKIQDPYDTFDKIISIAQENESTKIFWLLGDYGKYDKNISHTCKEQKYLIQKMSSYALVGLHPSYRSNKKVEQLKVEKERLENILKKKVLHTRQHYLKVQLPNTFRVLEKEGFTDDYSLGYADVVGFRAGIARSFLWFDIENDKMSNLRLHPITYMDGTLNEYMKLSIDEALDVVEKLKNEVAEYGGKFISLWHNETIGDYQNWKGWSKVLEKSIK